MKTDSPMQPDSPMKPLEEAKALLLEDRKRREEACLKEVNAVLERHGMVLLAGSPMICQK